jgi:osmotically-inducible protein OsmY
MTVRHSRLVQRVGTSLRENPKTRDAVIDVVNENGTVTLTGTAPSNDVRQAAEKIAQKQEGVIHVINELRIEADGQEGEKLVMAPPAHVVHGAVVDM